jgi:hypothetical protein
VYYKKDVQVFGQANDVSSFDTNDPAVGILGLGNLGAGSSLQTTPFTANIMASLNSGVFTIWLNTYVHFSKLDS